MPLVSAATRQTDRRAARPPGRGRTGRMRKRAANSSVLPVDAEPHREQRGLRSVRELELCEHLAHIALHRSFGEVQHAADLPIALALREQAEYRALALGQERKRTRVRRSAHAV